VQPGVGALDRPALAGIRVACFGLALAAAPDLVRARREGVALAASPADLRLDRPRAQLLAQRLGVVAAVGPDLGGAQAAGEQLIDQRQQVALLVLVPGRKPDGKRGAVGVDG
jgi:hypothetical protein